MNLAYDLLKLILKGYMRVLSLDSVVSGAYPLPAGPKIIAPNHPNATDSFFLPFVVPEHLHFLIQQSVFAHPIRGWLLRESLQVKVNRPDGRLAFKEACQRLERGETIVIYPEARLNPDYQTYRARCGAVRMSLETGAPIIPLGIYVPRSNLIVKNPDGDKSIVEWRWQTSGRCYLNFGDPWRPEKRPARPTPSVAHQLTDQLMRSIYDLVAQIRITEEQCESRTFPNLIPQP